MKGEYRNKYHSPFNMNKDLHTMNILSRVTEHSLDGCTVKTNTTDCRPLDQDARNKVNQPNLDSVTLDKKVLSGYN